MREQTVEEPREREGGDQHDPHRRRVNVKHGPKTLKQKRDLCRSAINNRRVTKEVATMVKRNPLSGSKSRHSGPRQQKAVLVLAAVTLSLAWYQWGSTPPTWVWLVGVLLFVVSSVACSPRCISRFVMVRRVASATKTSKDATFPIEHVVFPSHPPPTQTPSWDYSDTTCNFANLVGLDAKTARNQLLLATFPRYRHIEVYPEGTRMATQDKQFYRLRMIVDQNNKVKRIHSMV